MPVPSWLNNGFGYRAELRMVRGLVDLEVGRPRQMRAAGLSVASRRTRCVLRRRTNDRA
jgi:hypothetical protein